MKVVDLKETLEGIDGRAQVKLAFLPGNPMGGRIYNICVERDSSGVVRCVWLACSDNIGRDCPPEVWDESDISL